MALRINPQPEPVSDIEQLNQLIQNELILLARDNEQQLINELYRHSLFELFTSSSINHLKQLIINACVQQEKKGVNRRVAIVKYLVEQFKLDLLQDDRKNTLAIINNDEIANIRITFLRETAKIFYLKKMHFESITLLNKAIKITNHFTAAPHLTFSMQNILEKDLSNIYLALHDYHAQAEHLIYAKFALDKLATYCQIDPWHLVTLNVQLAEALFKLNDLDRATYWANQSLKALDMTTRETTEQFIKLKDTEIKIHLLLANIFEQKTQMHEKIKHLTHACDATQSILSVSPTSSDFQVGMATLKRRQGIAYFHLNNFEASAACLREAFEFHRNHNTDRIAAKKEMDILSTWLKKTESAATEKAKKIKRAEMLTSKLILQHGKFSATSTEKSDQMDISETENRSTISLFNE